MKLKSTIIIFCLTNALLWCLVRPMQIESTLSDKTTSKSCLEPKASGVCRGKLLRYAYDEKSNSCVSFYYSGCGATQNNFLTYEECRRECIPQSRY
ncbi:trypsin inhibitor-like [Cochliomyia hominivorax]